MSWKKVKLGEFLKVRDNRFKPNDKAIADLKRIDKIDFSGEIFISDKPSNTDMILIKKGDLVISGINVEKGAMAVYTGEEDITATIHYSSYSFDENKTDIEFLKSFLKSIEFKNALKEQVPGGIKTEIKPKHILPLVVEIPTDIKDQREVVKLLHNRNSKVDAISTELTNQLYLVKKLRQQLLQDAVQGKLVEQNKKDEPASELLKKIKADKEKLIAEKKLKKEKQLLPIKPEEIPFEIPENWCWCRLGEITLEVAYGTSEKADIVGEVPVLRMGNITSEGEILYSNLKYVSSQISDLPKLYLQNGDLVFNRTNSYELVGKSGVFENSEPFTLASYLIRVRFFKHTQSKYVASYINSKVCRETQLEPQIIQQNGQANFNGTKLSNIIIPLPPISEQNRIVHKLDELMQYCNVLEASIKQSESQNEKILQQVLREALRKEPVGV
jgi:type I restriction enzyme S subunit